MRLVKLIWRQPPGLPGLRASTLTTLDVGSTVGPFRDWRVLLRGLRIILVSPPGWNASEYDKVAKTERTVYVLNRDDVSEQWAFDDGEPIDGMKEWTQPEAPPRAAPPMPAPAVLADSLRDDEPDAVVPARRVKR